MRWLGPLRGKPILDRSESNIYIEPKSPRQRMFKTVFKVGGKDVEY